MPDRGHLLRLPNFQMQMVRWDGMHTVNLGADLWTCGSVMKKLLDYDLFGGLEMDESDRLLIMYDRFKTWCRQRRVEYLRSYSASCFLGVCL